MTAPLDIDALERDLAAVGPGPLVDKGCDVNAVWRAVPALIAEVRAGRAAWDEVLRVAGVTEDLRPEFALDQVASVMQRAADAFRDSRAAHAENRSLRVALGEAFCAGHDAGWNDCDAAEKSRLQAEWAALSHGPPVLPAVDREGDKERALTAWRRLASGQGKVEP
jgi:hypothetical protein